MITLLGAILAKAIVDAPQGMAFVPLDGLFLDTADRGNAAEIPLECLAVIELFGGKEGDQFDLGIEIAPPDAPFIDLGPKTHTWLDTPALSIKATIRQPVPINGGGLYVLKFSLDGQPLVDLSVPIIWTES